MNRAKTRLQKNCRWRTSIVSIDSRSKFINYLNTLAPAMLGQ